MDMYNDLYYKIDAIRLGDDRVTAEMCVKYINRTAEHIGRVRANLMKLASYDGFEVGTMFVRGNAHDFSKFYGEELEAYIWLSWNYRCVAKGVDFEYPEDIKPKISAAVQLHYKANPHHPEYYDGDISQMKTIDIIDMVCDWTAMSQEFGQDGGSAINWAKNMQASKRWKSRDRDWDFIYATIAELDKRNGVNSPQ